MMQDELVIVCLVRVGDFGRLLFVSNCDSLRRVRMKCLVVKGVDSIEVGEEQCCFRQGAMSRVPTSKPPTTIPPNPNPNPNPNLHH